MKTNKKYRKYTTMTQDQLNELIGLNDYTYVEMYHEPNTIPSTILNCIWSITFMLDLVSVIYSHHAMRVCLYKHNIDKSYLIIFKNETLNVEYYIYCADKEYKVINRYEKPAFIKIKCSSASTYITASLYYIQNNIEHRDFGPQTLLYEQHDRTNNKFFLSQLAYKQNGILYRSNGIVKLSFNNHTDINLDNGIAKSSIVCSYRQVIKNNVKYSINYKLGNHLLVNSIMVIFLDYPGKYIKINDGIYFYENSTLHRYEGPAILTKNDGIEKKSWFINGEFLPDTIVKLTNNIPNKPLTKANILEAMLFNRNYGEYLLNLSKEKTI